MSYSRTINDEEVFFEDEERHEMNEGPGMSLAWSQECLQYDLRKPVHPRHGIPFILIMLFVSVLSVFSRKRVMQ